MLGNQLAAALNECVRSFLLCCLVVPGVGVTNVHGSGGAYGASAKEEGGVAGNNLCIGECADVTDLCLCCGNVAGKNHRIELQTCSNTCEVTALVDSSEGVVEVSKGGGVGLGTRCVAELHGGEVLCCLDHVLLMTEGVCKYHLAALVNQVSSGLVASLALRHVVLHDDLSIRQAKRLGCFECGNDEVLVVGGVLIMQADEAHLQVCLGDGSQLNRQLVLTAGCEHEASADTHHADEEHRKDFLRHCRVLQKIFYYKGVRPM